MSHIFKSGSPKEPSGNGNFSQDERSSNNTPPDDDSFRDYWRKELHSDEEEEQKKQEAGQQQYWNGYDDHGFRNTTDPNYGPIPEEYESNAMSRAAYACGIVSVIGIFFSFVFFGMSFLIGSLGILFALLSRRNKFSRQARHAIRMCSIGIGVTAATVVLSFAVVIQSGMWGTVVKRMQEIDLNDPNSVTVVEQELVNDFLERYGLDADSSAASSENPVENQTQGSSQNQSEGTAESRTESSETGNSKDGAESGGLSELSPDSTTGII